MSVCRSYRRRRNVNLPPPRGVFGWGASSTTKPGVKIWPLEIVKFSPSARPARSSTAVSCCFDDNIALVSSAIQVLAKMRCEKMVPQQQIHHRGKYGTGFKMTTSTFWNRKLGLAEYPIQLQNPWEVFENGGLVLDKSEITRVFYRWIRLRT